MKNEGKDLLVEALKEAKMLMLKALDESGEPMPIPMPTFRFILPSILANTLDGMDWCKEDWRILIVGKVISVLKYRIKKLRSL